MHLWNAELSLCRESERGHTTPQTHTRNTWIHPHLKRPPLSSCVPPLFALKHTHTHTHTHCTALLPASVRLPMPVGTRLCVCCCWLWFAVWCGGPAVVPGHCKFGGVEMAVWSRGGVGVGGADSSSSRHSTSFVIFISHVCLFLGLCVTSKILHRCPRPPLSNIFKQRFKIKFGAFTQDSYGVETSCNSFILQTLQRIWTE